MQSFTFWNTDPKACILNVSLVIRRKSPIEQVELVLIPWNYSSLFRKFQTGDTADQVILLIRAYHFLYKKFSNFENLPIKLLLKLFSTTIIPILLYNCEIWGPYLLGKINSFEIFKSKIFKVINEIERFHLKFCKCILGVHSKTTNIAICAELGRIPLIAQISLHIVNKLH